MNFAELGPAIGASPETTCTTHNERTTASLTKSLKSPQVSLRSQCGRGIDLGSRVVIRGAIWVETPAYSINKLEQIGRKIAAHSEDLLKESWVQKNPILRGLARTLTDRRKQAKHRQSLPSLVDKSPHSPSHNTLRLALPLPASKTTKASLNLARLAIPAAPAGGGVRKRFSTATLQRNQNLVKQYADLLVPPPGDSAEDKRLMLHNEINMELASHMLQELIGRKKKKRARLTLTNTQLTNEMRKLDEESPRNSRLASPRSRMVHQTFRTAVQREKYKLDVDICQKREARTKLRAEVHRNLEKISQITHKISLLKQEVLALRAQQAEYYYKLLADGKEVRQEGLSWIIKALWYLGLPVTPSHCPNYLDPLAAHFLLNVSKGLFSS